MIYNLEKVITTLVVILIIKWETVSKATLRMIGQRVL